MHPCLHTADLKHNTPEYVCMLVYMLQTFSKNGKPTMSAYDKDLWEVLTSTHNTFYMFRDLQIYHGCLGEYNCPF